MSASAAEPQTQAGGAAGSRPARGRPMRRAFLGVMAAVAATVAATGAASAREGLAYMVPAVSAPTTQADEAIQYYTKALRGAARVATPGTESAGFRTLADMSYTAVRMRKARDYVGASSVYRSALTSVRGGLLSWAAEVEPAVAAAHATLNLALTEQAQGRYDRARLTFQKGAALVQVLISDHQGGLVDSDRKLKVGAREASEWDASSALNEGLQWLATLLTSWALLETKRGKACRALLLARRAASLDSRKAPLLNWKPLQRQDPGWLDGHVAASSPAGASHPAAASRDERIPGDPRFDPSALRPMLEGTGCPLKRLHNSVAAGGARMAMA